MLNLAQFKDKDADLDANVDEVADTSSANSSNVFFPSETIILKDHTVEYRLKSIYDNLTVVIESLQRKCEQFNIILNFMI